MQYKYNGTIGLTMVELLLSLGLFSISLPVLLLIFSTAHQLYEGYQARMDSQYSCRCALYWIMEDFRTGKDFEVLENGSRLRIVNDKESILYYVENNNLFRHSTTKMPVAELISQISCQELSPQTVEIIIESTIGSQAYRLVTRSSFRNQDDA
ncbi:MAG: hypothetical protein GX550_04300 [Syntrophomonadaceae bacterium]|nr:hypothetical protein [Syntrophomonadaceae bacterium]